MKEIICLNIGQAGIHIANSFWELIALEHNISLDGTRLNTEVKDNPLSLFSCSETNKYVPRSINIDLDADTIMETQTGPLRRLYRPDSYISGKSGGCVYSCGHDGKEAQKLKQESLDKLRSMAETCDNLQGIMIFHSIAGGTGSGLASAILSSIGVQHGRVPKISFSLYPSARMSSSPIEAYNALFSQYAMMDDTDLCILFDNAAIYNILSDKLEVTNPSYKNINQLIAQMASSITTCTRFETSGLNGIKELVHNLLIYPRIHHILPSYGPLTNIPRLFHEQPSAFSITDGLFDPLNAMISADSTQGPLLASCVMYRGDVIQYDINHAIEDVKAKRSLKFLKMSGQGIKYCTTSAPPVTVPDADIAEMARTGAALMNSGCISKYMELLLKQAESLYSRRAFLHWFAKDWSASDTDIYYNEAKELLKSIAADYSDVSVPDEAQEECEGEGG